MSNGQSPHTHNKKSSSHKIGLATATIVGMNAMIGSGIFTTPAALSANVGPAGILAYFFVVPAVWFMALSIARLSELYPQEGSFYVYAKQWGGHRIGLLAVGAYFAGLLIAMGLLSQMIGAYLFKIIPAYSAWTLGFAALWTLVALNIFGVVLSQLGQHILIILTLFPLLVTTILCLANGQFTNLVPFAPYGYLNVLKATRIVIFGFFGFECAASLFNIVREPHKNVPKALSYSIGIVGIVYTLFVSSLILSVPLELFTSEEIPLSDVLSVIFPNSGWLITAIHLSILSAMVGTVHSMIWSSSHLLQLIVKKLHGAAEKIRLSQPLAVLTVGCFISLSYITLKNPDLFFNLTALFIVSAFILSMITLLTIKEEWNSGQNYKTLLGILTALVILIFAVEGLLTSLLA